MKIGILTLPLHTNYGGILQAWALQTVLERMGHDVVVYNTKRYDTNIFKLLLKIPFRVFRNALKRTNYDAISEFHLMKREKNTSRFIKKYIRTRSLTDVNQIKSDSNDAIVVGSDQVWSHIHGGNICGSVINAFLPFSKSPKQKIISYAASFGKDNWEYTEEETSICKKLIQCFDAVSVREESAVDLCKLYLSHDAIRVVDPTLLLDLDDYLSKLQIEEVQKSQGNLLLYILDSTSDKSAIANYVQDHLNLKPFAVNSKVEDTNRGCYSEKDKIQPPVEQWLRGFYDADFIVTDSFHACVFSILFKKNFIVTGNAARGNSRFDTLLKTFGLTDRRISTFDADEINKITSQNIDYDSVYKILEQERVTALTFLKDNL